MSLYDVLDQVVALLKSRGRVSYRALKREFNLDDEFLEDLKEELLFASHPVCDEEGRGLVWTGKTGDVPESTTQPDQTTRHDTQEAEPTLGGTQTSEPHTPDAERRQLTVMFCDLVGSTSLSGELDPEDLRDIVKAYQTACTEVIQRYDGYVAQLLGDGLLVYFGYPQAHEDDAQRAIHAGLGILNAIETLNNGLKQKRHIELSVRLGIHTGLVVVGEMGSEGRQEQLALGETPNVAARIQGLAEPDTLIVSDATYRLVQGFFDCDSLGKHDLRGVSESVPVHRVLQPSGAQHRLDISNAGGLTPLVGRESEVTLLLERWEQAQNGQGQVVLLSGEAGIGKSRLVQTLKDHVAEESHTRLECRSSPYYQNSALYPIIDLLQRTLRWQQGDTPGQRLEKLEHELSQYQLPVEETVPLFAALLSLTVPEDRYPDLILSPQRQRQKTLETILAIILELAEQQPVLFILEDAHWLDASTNELLGLLIDQTPTASLLILITYRPEFQHTWNNRSYLTQVALSRLSQGQIESIAIEVAGGKTLPKEVIAHLVERTDGVPLYVEEMTKSVLESGVLKETNGQYELTGPVSSLSIPSTLQDSLMARLDRLVTAKGIAQMGATIGRQFSYELLCAVSDVDEETLKKELNRLVEAELVYQRGLPPQATYTFKHALIQDTAYESLLRRTRQGYHRRIADVLEERFSNSAETQPELLAHHYTEAGLNEQAVEYWYRAGQQALQNSANQEAIRHFSTGIELLANLPNISERTQQELDFQMALCPALMATKGWTAPEVEQAYTRAQELCQRVGDTPHVFQALRGLFYLRYMRAEYQVAQELAESLLQMGNQRQDAIWRLFGHHSLGVTLLMRGEARFARSHFDQGIALYNAQEHKTLAVRYGQDPGVLCLIYAGMGLWLLGYPEQAIRRSQEALTLAQDLSHLYSVGMAQGLLSYVHQWRQEEALTREMAGAALTLGTEQGFPSARMMGTFLRGWALAKQGQSEEGIRQIHQGLTILQTIEARIFRSYVLALLVEAHQQAEQFKEGMKVLAEALAVVDKTGERWWEAELYRLQGELLFAQSLDNTTEAETSFYKALDIACHQKAKSFELRAATSLARLWQGQGKRDKARELLAPVYSWFSEGFDTADLVDAKMLLDELT